jgi:hypothetical protein
MEAASVERPLFGDFIRTQYGLWGKVDKSTGAKAE